jgi:hypothetical protein
MIKSSDEINGMEIQRSVNRYPGYSYPRVRSFIKATVDSKRYFAAVYKHLSDIQEGAQFRVQECGIGFESLKSSGTSNPPMYSRRRDIA